MKRFGLTVKEELQAWRDEEPRLHGSPVLVIVDMQPVFRAAKSPYTIEQVCIEIANARRKGWWIIVVEFSCPTTLPREERETDASIMAALSGYHQTGVVPKAAEDGSVELLAALQVIGVLMRRMIVCGVNTGRCVAETMFGVMEKKMSLSVTAAINACNDDDPGFSCSRWIGSSPYLRVRFRAQDED